MDCATPVVATVCSPSAPPPWTTPSSGMLSSRGRLQGCNTTRWTVHEQLQCSANTCGSAGTVARGLCSVCMPPAEEPQAAWHLPRDTRAHLHVPHAHHVVLLDHVRPHPVDQQLGVVDVVGLQQASNTVSIPAGHHHVCIESQLCKPDRHSSVRVRPDGSWVLLPTMCNVCRACFRERSETDLTAVCI